jgi:dipeptidyl-peptidase-4
MKKLIKTTSLFYVVYVCLFNLTSVAQTKLLTLEDAVLNLRTKLAPINLKQLSFAGSDNLLCWVDTGVTKQFVFVETKNLKPVRFITLKELNEALKKNELNEQKDLPLITWIESDRFYFKIEQTICFYSIQTRSIERVIKLPAEAENIDISTQNKQVAYTIQNQLFVTDGRNTRVIEDEKNLDIIYGKAVHRNEFGIEKGTFWSPNGNLLAFYRMDQTMVEDYPIINWTEDPAKNQNIKYPMAGRKSHEVTIGVYNTISGSVIYLNTGQPNDQYLTNIAWSNDESIVYVAVLNREQNFMKLNAYDAKTGNYIKTLFTEQDSKYVEPLHPLQFISNNEFVWQSNRDGFNHLYLYNTEGKLLKQLTKGAWEVTEVNYIDKVNRCIYYTATTESPLYRDGYKLEINTGKLIRLTQQKGTHTLQVSPNAGWIIDHFQSLTTPRLIKLINTKTYKNQELLNASNPLKDYQIVQPELFTIKSNNGDDLYCRMYKPLNFDATKKYPVIVYLYNGPHVQLIQDNWITTREGWFYYMAQLGYIVFNLDGRGSDNRGKAFEQATFRKLGTVEMQDQLSGIEFLKKQPFVDPQRIGVHGWSFGGFMTTSLMTRNAGIFKVGVAGGPVIDWSKYEVMYTERYMDTPQENKQGYDESNLLNYVTNLKGKLLMIHGTDDDVVVWQHSLLFVKSCIDKGVQLDYFVYPGHKHNVLGKDRVHLMQKITNYFLENL